MNLNGYILMMKFATSILDFMARANTLCGLVKADKTHAARQRFGGWEPLA
jgi:hypothetical protein